MEREARLTRELYSYPSFLTTIEDLKSASVSRQKMNQVMHKISSELDTYDTHMETVRDYNLFGFIHFELGDKTKAYDYIERSLLIHQNNINALILKAWFAIKSSDAFSCEKLLSEIRKLIEDEKEKTIARAEVAYFYTRFGPKLYNKAEEMFGAVLAAMTDSNIEVNPNTVAIWTFGLTLVVRRTLNFNNLFAESNYDFTMNKVMRVFRNYQSILRSKQVDTKYKARSMVELGGLLDNPHIKKENITDQANSDLSELFEYSADHYFNHALKYSDADRFVLERCGRHYRYSPKTVDKAIVLLHKSLSIKETSFAYHHLGLALKRKLEIQRWSNKSGNFSGHNYKDYRSGHQRNRNTNLHQSKPDRGQHEPTDSSSRCLKQTQTIYVRQGMLTRDGRDEKVSNYHTAAGGLDTYFESLVSDLDSMQISSGSYSDMKNRQTKYIPNRKRHNYTPTMRGRPEPRPQTTNIETPRQSAQSNKLKNFIKSPKKVTYLDGSDETEVQTILGHFDKSFSMDENMSALYDKGLTLRALRRFDEALGVFRQCFGRGNLSLVYQANSYEQAALCIIDKLEGLQDGENNEQLVEEMNHNLQHYLNVCVEISCKKILPLIADIRLCWSSFDILKDRLNAGERSKENLEALGGLHSKVENYAEANKFFKQLLEVEDTEKGREDVVREMVKNYCKLRNYDEAIILADLMPQRITDLEMKVHILVEGGFQAYANKEYEISKMRLKRAINAGCRFKDYPVEDGESAEKFDVFIVCSDTMADSSRCVKAALENIGLSVTLNFDDLPVFDSKSDGLLHVMENSTHFVVFVDFDAHSEDINDMKHYIENIRNIRIKRNYGKSLFVQRADSTTLPVSYAHEPRIDYDSDIENASKEETLKDGQLSWIKQVIELIAKSGK